MIIYVITNRINGKKYVGQTIKTLNERWLEHVYHAYRGSRNHFHQAIVKHGIENFDQEIVENCMTRELLDLAERHWILNFRTTDPSIGYNMTEGGDGGKIVPEAALKISQKLKGRKQSPEAIRNRTKTCKGRKYSDEARANMKKARNQRTDKHTNEFKEMMSKRQCDLWADPIHRQKMLEIRQKQWTKESRQNASIAHKGRQHSEESKKKMSEIAKHRWQRIHESGRYEEVCKNFSIAKSKK